MKNRERKMMMLCHLGAGAVTSSGQGAAKVETARCALLSARLGGEEDDGVGIETMFQVKHKDHGTAFLDTNSKIRPDCHIYASKAIV